MATRLNQAHANVIRVFCRLQKKLLRSVVLGVGLSSSPGVYSFLPTVFAVRRNRIIFHKNKILGATERFFNKTILRRFRTLYKILTPLGIITTWHTSPESVDFQRVDIVWFFEILVLNISNCQLHQPVPDRRCPGNTGGDLLIHW